MRSTLDRYVFKEILPPFFLALLIFTFLLVLPPVMDYLENLLAKGVTWGTAVRILWTLLPQALGLTIPMAVLVGILIGLGRMSGDRESVALLACGVSPYRLLRPIGVLAVLSALATAYVMIVAIPNANQTFREITFAVISQRVETDIRPRVFFEDFPGLGALREGRAGPRSARLEEADGRRGPDRATSRPSISPPPGGWSLDHEKQTVDLVLVDGTIYRTGEAGEETDTTRFPAELVLGLNPEAVFPKLNLQPGINEKTLAELRADAADKVQQGDVAASRGHRDSAAVLVPGRLPGVRGDRPGARADGRPRRQARRLRRRDAGDLRLLHRDVPVGVADQGALPEHVLVALGAQYPARRIRGRRA